MSCKITFESIIKFLQYNLLLKLGNFVYSCRILFSLKQFLFHNFMLYRAEKILVFVEGRNFKI